MIAYEQTLGNNSHVLRRAHVADLRTGEIALDDQQSHHLRDVLRLAAGDPVELFDNAGNIAVGTILHSDPRQVIVRIEQMQHAQRPRVRCTIFSALPKGERADWMVEKLSELGVERFVPLATQRSVVLPKGKGKSERWLRIATESAKQSRRAGVMELGPLTSLSDAILQTRDAGATGWYLSTAPAALPITRAIGEASVSDFHLFIGPEGGWTQEEIRGFENAHIVGIKLTDTVLRVETAAITAAAIVHSIGTPSHGTGGPPVL